MRVRLNRTIGGRPDLREGAEADIDDAIGETLCRRGLADRIAKDTPAVIEAVPDSDIETVPKRRGRPKRHHSEGDE